MLSDTLAPGYSLKKQSRCIKINDEKVEDKEGAGIPFQLGLVQLGFLYVRGGFDNGYILDKNTV